MDSLASLQVFTYKSTILEPRREVANDGRDW